MKLDITEQDYVIIDQSLQLLLKQLDKKGVYAIVDLMQRLEQQRAADKNG